MTLASLQSEEGASCAVESVWPLLEELFPICRSITGDGVRRTLDGIERLIPLERTEVASGTQVFDWEIPLEWNIKDAYVANKHGNRVIDFRQNSLHVLNYSKPVRRTLSLEELQDHLHSLPDHPDWIPYRTSYYREQWGFCLRHRDRERLGPGPYDVVIDSSLKPGHLTYAECRIDGQTDAEAIVYTHTCHPSLANDNLTGIAASIALARALRNQRPRLTWRFIFGPGTIGSLTWLSRNESQLERVRCGLVIGLLGDAGKLTYKRSRRGNTDTDAAAEYVLNSLGVPHRVVDFEPYGYDERQFCSPGFDLPVGRLTRSMNGEYPEYHTSADNLEFIHVEHLATSVQAIAQLIGVLDQNRRLINLSPKGEPQLGKRGLYGSVGGMSPSESQQALLWVLNQSDGDRDLVSIAAKSRLPFPSVLHAAEALERAHLATAAPEVKEVTR